jgi:prepilin-type N-terminal cleavage/methylation domain-containing protein
MRYRRGFTLAEMAMAVVILSLLLFAAMVPFSTQLDVRNIADTRRTMDSIREALLGFAQTNGRLPCPANGATRAGTIDATTWPTSFAAGAEQWDAANNQCYIAFGVVPWTTLGVPETDAWGRRFTYRVTPAFADGIARNSWQSRLTAPAGFPSQNLGVTTGGPPPTSSPADQNPTCPSPAGSLSPAPSLSSFALCSLGDIAVFTRTISAATPVGSSLPLVFVSHGKNGWGGWQSSGVRTPMPAAGSDEAANVNATATTPNGLAYTQWTFFSRNPTPAASGCSDPAPLGASASPLCEFDDIVVSIPAATLITRMVAAGKLP